MITEFILNMFFAVANVLLSPISILGWGFDLVFISPIGDILKVVYYVLPISKLSPIIIFIVSSLAFRIVIALIKTIKQLLLFG